MRRAGNSAGVARGAAAGVGRVLYFCIAVAAIAGGAVGVTPGLRKRSVYCIVIGHAHARMAPKALVCGRFVVDSDDVAVIAARCSYTCSTPMSLAVLGDIPW